MVPGGARGVAGPSARCGRLPVVPLVERASPVLEARRCSQCCLLCSELPVSGEASCPAAGEEERCPEEHEPTGPGSGQRQRVRRPRLACRAHPRDRAPVGFAPDARCAVARRSRWAVEAVRVRSQHREASAAADLRAVAVDVVDPLVGREAEGGVVGVAPGCSGGRWCRHRRGGQRLGRRRGAGGRRRCRGHRRGRGGTGRRGGRGGRGGARRCRRRGGGRARRCGRCCGGRLCEGGAGILAPRPKGDADREHGHRCLPSSHCRLPCPAALVSWNLNDPSRSPPHPRRGPWTHMSDFR